MAESTRQRLLKYAAEKLGKPEVAKRLKVEEETLNAWLWGETEMPNAKLGELADLIDSIPKGR